MIPPSSTSDGDRTLDILICTFRRPHIRTTLEAVRALDVPKKWSFRVVVADNDDHSSALSHIGTLIDDPKLGLRYIHQPGRNISIARNACLDAARSDWIAFLDDDEIPERDWLTRLIDRQTETGADGIFGVVKSVFPETAPSWMRELNLHAPGPQRTNGVVRTGGAGNVLLRWADSVWADQRFDIARGRTGGEDTEFFYRIGRMGARFEIASDAIAREPVAPERLSFRWLARRRFRAGQTYAVSTVTRLARAKLAMLAALKAVVSLTVVLPFLWSAVKSRYWLLRAVFHLGVVAGCLNVTEQESYG